MASLNFDANNVAPSAPMEVVPPGKYLVHIINSELRSTNNGNGQMLWLELDILDEEHKNRKLWDRLNLENPNAQTVEIAQRTLSAICHATGQLQVTDSQQLHYKPMLANVKVRPAGPDKTGTMRDAQSEIRGYEAAPGARSSGYTPPAPVATPPRSAPATAVAAPAGVAKSPPWKRASA